MGKMFHLAAFMAAFSASVFGQSGPIQRNPFTTTPNGQAVTNPVTLANPSNSFYGDFSVDNTNFAWISDSSVLNLGGTSSSAPAAQFFNQPTHSDDPEYGMVFNSSVAIVAGAGQQQKSSVQFGHALAVHDIFFFEPDSHVIGIQLVPYWPTDGTGPSKLLLFGVDGAATYYAGFRGELSGDNGSEVITTYNPSTWIPRHVPITYMPGVPQTEVSTNGFNVDKRLTVGTSGDEQLLRYLSAMATSATVSEIKALGDFITAAQVKGYWRKFIAFYPMRGGSSNSVSWNLINTNTFPLIPTATGVAYTNGITLDGVSGKVATTIVPSTSFASKSNAMFFCWVNNTNPPVDNAAFFGSYDGDSTAAFGLRVFNQGGSYGNYAFFPNLTSGVNVYGLVTASNYSGFMAVNMNNTNRGDYYVNSVLFGSQTVVSTAFDTVAITLGDTTLGGQFINCSYTFAGAGTNFTLLDMTNLIADLTVLRAAMTNPAPAYVLYVNGNETVNGSVTATGFSSTASNLLAPVAITFPATTVNWTNTTGRSATLFIDNTGVTGTAIKVNGAQVFGTILPVDMTLPLQNGEYFSETYTVGTPTAKIKPF